MERALRRASPQWWAGRNGILAAIQISVSTPVAQVLNMRSAWRRAIRVWASSSQSPKGTTNSIAAIMEH
jgi:hypothetical protein